MKALEQLQRFKKMNQLIKAECTGTPDEFSNWLGISRRQLYSDIEYINDIGVKISYSKNRRTFYYCNGHELEISFSIKVISKENTQNINGGFLYNRLRRAFFMHGTSII